MLETRWDLICFTGSTAVGKLVYQSAAKHLTPVILELGGKSPVYIHKDANIEVAAARIAWGKTINCGQTCIAPDYLLIDQAVKQPFLSALVKQIKLFYGEDALKSKDYDRVVSDRHMHRISGLLNGQEIFYGGKVDEENRKIEPTIVVDPKLDSPLMQEEIFGPVLPVVTVKSPEEAIKFINGKPKPLALYIFSTSKGIQEKFINETSAGGVCLNDCISHYLNTNLPFGGVGDSGVGAYHGKFTFESFSHLKPIQDALNFQDPYFKYPPYTDSGSKLVRWVMGVKFTNLKRIWGVAKYAFYVLFVYLLYDRFFAH
jgi:acyl-CoA reductase-like NAD-dependent aldehyde dehydrogenase